MKKIIAFGIFLALCATCFAGCDMGNGLIAELFGNGVGDYVLDGDVILVDPIEPYPDVQTDVAIGIETWTEIATEPPVEYPTGDDDTIGMETGTVEPDYSSPADAFTLDGDLSDWARIDCYKQDFDASNLDAWMGEVGDGGFTMYVGCGSEFVYLAFDVRDTTPAYSETDTYNGDCFQIQIDFNGWMAYTKQFERGIFYSFGLQEDGSVNLTVQCIENDVVSTVDYVTSSRNGDLKGITVAKADGSGWIAEFAIPWTVLYRDACEKLASIGEVPPAIDDWGNTDVCLNMLVCYIDRQEQEGTVLGAWGTSKAPETLLSPDGWYPENCGLKLTFQTRLPSVHGQYR